MLNDLFSPLRKMLDSIGDRASNEPTNSVVFLFLQIKKLKF
jgi:hypothetical protein